MRGLVLALALATGMVAGVALAPLHAQQTAPAPTPANLAWFHGEWEGEVDFIGTPAKGRLVIRPGLAGSATIMAFTADVAATAKRPAFRFEGQGTYRIKPDGSVTGTWSDSFGNFHLLKGRTRPGELRVNWGDARSEVGHSSYVLGTDGVLTVTDSALIDGEVQVFGTATYRKKP